MNSYKETRVLNYTAEQIYGLVLDVEKYPEFLPWCANLRVVNRQSGSFTADMMVRYKVFSETFRTKVVFHQNSSIDVDYIDGPFSSLSNHWKFKDLSGNCCEVSFFVEFEFESSVLQKFIQVFFSDAVKVMIKAFEARAEAIYGDCEVK